MTAITTESGYARLIVSQGSTFRRVIYVEDADGNAINLAGCSARMQARLYPTAAEALIDLDSGSKGGITIGAAAGTLTIEISAEDTALLSWSGWAVYDIEIIYADSSVSRVLEGGILLDAEVTREEVEAE